MGVEWSVSPFVYPFVGQKKGHDHTTRTMMSTYPEAMSEVAFFSVSEYVLKIFFKKKKQRRKRWGDFFSYCLIHLIYDTAA